MSLTHQWSTLSRQQLGRWLGPELGEHTTAVYRELLGLTDAELDVLRARQVI